MPSQLEPRTPNATQDLVHKFLVSFHTVVRVLDLYPQGNSAVLQAVDILHRGVQPLLEKHGTLTIQRHAEGFMVNHTRVRQGITDHASVAVLQQLFNRHGIDVLSIEKEVSVAELNCLGLELQKSEVSSKTSLGERFLTAGVYSIHVSSLPQRQTRQELLKTAQTTYLRALAAFREATKEIQQGKPVQFKQLKQAVQGIVDQVLHNEPFIVFMASLREREDDSCMHSVNVCVLSILLGHRIGLDKSALYDLGFCGLMHDVGKMQMSHLEEADKLTAAEWELMQSHPVEGLLALAGMSAQEEIPLRSMLAAYEHHVKSDLSGYPRITRARKPGLFSKMVALVDVFDAVTSSRSDRARPWPADKALRNLRDEPQWGVDPILVKALISTLGIHPIGSVVILDSGCLALVTAANFEHPQWPELRIISDDQEQELLNGPFLDLSAVQSDPDAPKIVRSIDAQQYQIDTLRYFA